VKKFIILLYAPRLKKIADIALPPRVLLSQILDMHAGPYFFAMV